MLSKRFSRLLTIELKLQRVDDSEACFEMFRLNKRVFISSVRDSGSKWIPQHSGVKTIVIWMDFSPRKTSKAVKSATFGQQGYDVRNLGILIIDHLDKGKTISSEYYMTLLEHFKRNRGTALNANDKSARQSSPSKLHEKNIKFLPYPPYSPDLSPSNVYLFLDLKQMLQLKRFGANNEVIGETEVCFRQ